MPKGGEERVVLQGVIEKVRRRPSVDLSSNPRGSSVDQKPVSGAAGAATAGWWVEDGSVDRCMICAEPFGLMSRRHHCRACGNVICQVSDRRRGAATSAPLLTNSPIVCR